MKTNKWETRYYVLSFLLSLYLLFSIVISYVDVSEHFKEVNQTITFCILAFFVVEILFLLIISKDRKKFFKDNWISIAAIAVSIPAVAILKLFEGLGMFFVIYLVKVTKFFKFAKLIKVLKSIKLGKKTVKSIKKKSV